MQWSKIKNIVILILLVVNALLLAQVGYREMESARYRRQARDEAALLLAQSGIRVDVASLPEDPGLLSMRCERDSVEEAVLAEALLGSSAEQPDGSFSGERGTVWFYSSGEFYAVFKPGAWPVETTPEATAYRVMELLEMECETVSVTETDDTVLVRMRQTWEGTPIFSCETTLTFEGGELREVRGRRLPGTPTETAGNEAMTVTSVLIRFRSAISESGYVCSEILSLTAGYEMTAVPSSSTFTLTPVWQVETDVSTFLLEEDGSLTLVTQETTGTSAELTA